MRADLATTDLSFFRAMVSGRGTNADPDEPTGRKGHKQSPFVPKAVTARRGAQRRLTYLVRWEANGGMVNEYAMSRWELPRPAIQEALSDLRLYRGRDPHHDDVHLQTARHFSRLGFWLVALGVVGVVFSGAVLLAGPVEDSAWRRSMAQSRPSR